jgi:hypothetical protein
MRTIESRLLLKWSFTCFQLAACTSLHVEQLKVVQERLRQAEGDAEARILQAEDSLRRTQQRILIQEERLVQSEETRRHEKARACKLESDNKRLMEWRRNYEARCPATTRSVALAILSATKHGYDQGVGTMVFFAWSSLTQRMIRARSWKIKQEEGYVLPNNAQESHERKYVQADTFMPSPGGTLESPDRRHVPGSTPVFSERSDLQGDSSMLFQGSTPDVSERRHFPVATVRPMPDFLEERQLQVDSSTMFSETRNEQFASSTLLQGGRPDVPERRHFPVATVRPMPDFLEEGRLQVDSSAMFSETRNEQFDSSTLLQGGRPDVAERTHLQVASVSGTVPNFLEQRHLQADSSVMMPSSTQHVYEGRHPQVASSVIQSRTMPDFLARAHLPPEASTDYSEAGDVQAKVSQTLQRTPEHASIPETASTGMSAVSTFETPLPQCSNGRGHVGNCVWVESEATEQLSEAIANMRAWKLRHPTSPLSAQTASPL